MARQYQRSAETREILIAAATAHFADAGFDGASLDSVARRCGVSKGAIYHHFESKAALLEAVFDRTSMQCIEQAGTGAADEADPIRRIAAALRYWLTAVLQPVPRRIMLDIGPAGIGFARARAIEMKNSHALMRVAIEKALAAAPMPSRTKIVNLPDGCAKNAGLIAGLLNALVVELALDICAQGDGAVAGDIHFCMIDRLVFALISGDNEDRQHRQNRQNRQ